MRLKNPAQNGTWSFQLTDPEGSVINVPPSGTLNSQGLILGAVLQYIEVYDQATNGEYSVNLRKEAKKYGLDFSAYMEKVIQHQMCLKGGVECWSDGLGDNIHQFLGKVDGYIDRSPPMLRDKVRKAIAKITPSHVIRFSGCGSCGGAMIMNPNENPLGRAGDVNRITKGVAR